MCKIEISERENETEEIIIIIIISNNQVNARKRT